VILGTSMDSYWPVSFHAQQTAEKALKGLLTRHQIEFEKTHNIGELLRLVGAVIPDLPQRLGEATQLTRFAVADRYPLSGPAIDRDASAQHVALGRKVLTAIETALRDYLDAGRPSS
jgi:HEPN domain-containing protein